MFNIFEQPWTLLGLAILVLLVILSFRSILPDKRRWWQWLLPLIIAVAAFGADFLVQSDIEQIRDVIKKASVAVKEENTAAIGKLISENYSDSYHPTKQDLMYHCRRRLSEPLIEKSITRIRSIEVNSPKATVVFTTRLIFDKQSYVYESFLREILVKVELHLQKELDKGWFISRVEIEEINLQPANWRDIG